MAPQINQIDHWLIQTLDYLYKNAEDIDEKFVWALNYQMLPVYGVCLCLKLGGIYIGCSYVVYLFLIHQYFWPPRHIEAKIQGDGYETTMQVAQMG